MRERRTLWRVISSQTRNGGLEDGLTSSREKNQQCTLSISYVGNQTTQDNSTSGAWEIEDYLASAYRSEEKY